MTRCSCMVTSGGRDLRGNEEPVLGITGEAFGVVRREGACEFSLLRRLYGCEAIVHIAGHAGEGDGSGDIMRPKWLR